MRRLYFLAALLTAVGIPFGWVQNAQAHVLERDGGISAVLHMPPADAPVARQDTIINLAFASDDPRFTVINYQIELAVTQNGRTILTTTMQPLDQSDNDSTATIQLPQAGAYSLEVQGKPKTVGASFHLEYDIRASGAAGQDAGAQTGRQAGFDFWAITAGSWAVLIVIARSNLRRGGRY